MNLDKLKKIAIATIEKMGFEHILYRPCGEFVICFRDKDDNVVQISLDPGNATKVDEKLPWTRGMELSVADVFKAFVGNDIPYKGVFGEFVKKVASEIETSAKDGSIDELKKALIGLVKDSKESSEDIKAVLLEISSKLEPKKPEPKKPEQKKSKKAEPEATEAA